MPVGVSTSTKARTCAPCQQRAHQMMFFIAQISFFCASCAHMRSAYVCIPDILFAQRAPHVRICAQREGQVRQRANKCGKQTARAKKKNGNATSRSGARRMKRDARRWAHTIPPPPPPPPLLLLPPPPSPSPPSFPTSALARKAAWRKVGEQSLAITASAVRDTVRGHSSTRRSKLQEE